MYSDGNLSIQLKRVRPDDALNKKRQKLMIVYADNLIQFLGIVLSRLIQIFPQLQYQQYFTALINMFN